MIEVVLGYGLGVDSTAILLRWIHEPETRPCPLENILVVTAMTGDEWPVTGQLVTDHILPLLREHKIRYLQVARKGAFKADGIEILDDSRCPQHLQAAGAYALSMEMISSGTVPQLGGTRKCSLKFKGEIIDPVIERIVGATEHRPYWHAVGFEANEPKRAKRDKTYDTDIRKGFYPLIEWGWDRARCEEYITSKTGVAWVKSACTFCPFALANEDGRARVLGMYLDDPAAGLRALLMERISYSLNPRQALMGERKLADLLAGTGQHDHVTDLFWQLLDRMPWRLYEVQRVVMPGQRDPSRTSITRSLVSLAEGTEEQMNAELRAVPSGGELERGEDGVLRLYVQRRGEGVPAYEHMYVVAPAGAEDKERKAFTNALERYQAAAG